MSTEVCKGFREAKVHLEASVNGSKALLMGLWKPEKPWDPEAQPFHFLTITFIKYYTATQMLTSKISETKSQDVRIKPRLHFSKSLWGIGTGTLEHPAVTGSPAHALNEVSLTTMAKTGPLTQADSAKHNPSSTCLPPSVPRAGG